MTVKKLLLSLVSLCTLQIANAGNHYGRQPRSDDNKKFSFSFNAGLGIPTGGFANRDSIASTDSTHAHGFANKGFRFVIAVSYRFSDYVGIAAQLGGTLCSFDAGAYKDAFNISSSYDVSSSGEHFISEYMGGPYFFIPVSDNFCVEAKALFGIVGAQYPDITISSTQQNNYSGETYKFAHAQDFGYALSVGGRIKVDDMIGISLTVSYTGSAISYPGQVYSISTRSGYTYSGFSFADRSMSLGIIGITGGLVISF